MGIGLLVAQSITTFCNDWRSGRLLGTFIRSLASRNIFDAIFTDGKIDKFITKNFLPSISISCETCHDWLSFYDGIKVFMFNLKTVVVMNFEPIIIIKSLWRNWSHNISVLKSININQYQNKIMKLKLYCNLNKTFDCN